MVKEYIKEIIYCPSCPYFEYNNSFSLPEGWICMKQNKIIAPLYVTVTFIPDWCPLPDKSD